MTMSRVTPDLEYQTLAECNYCYPTEVLSDVWEARAAFPDLHLHEGYYYYPNNEKKKLVNLRGTVPIVYEGNKYNIPVCIWIHITHPQSPPRCLVCPSPCMMINGNSSSVDAQGHVLLHCLSNWKPGWSGLSIVLEEMVAAFQRETPLFATYPIRAPTLPPGAKQPTEWPGHRRPASAHNSWPNTSSNSAQRKSSHPESSSSSLSQATSNTDPKSDKDSQPQAASAEETSGVKRSYTQELLDFGITFGETHTRNNTPTNPFVTSATAPDSSASSPDDISSLFKSLQLERVVHMYQLEQKDKDIPHAWRHCQAPEEGPGPQVELLDDRHRVVVSHLPTGITPSRMKNKLTIYFQRKHSRGGEVVAVTYPLAQPDQAMVTFRHYKDAENVLKEPNRIVMVDDQMKILMKLKRFEAPSVSVPEDVRGDKAEMFRSILGMEGCGFSPADVSEAVQACRDVPSALKYLSHDCPICQERVSFSKMITMTHCSCAFCESCFKAFFSSVIKEKSIVHAVCPLCNQPDVRGPAHREVSVEYFSLLDTQIRHYLDPQTHELFQRKLRDQALQEMPDFRWCAHCSFGLLHEADRLRMDCPSCGKSTCSKCKSPWAPQHDGLSCEKFKEWQQLNSPEYQNSRLEQLLSRNKIDCPKCKFRFFLSKGGCLHFKCSQCQHDFCGGCCRPFKLGPECDFSAECGAKGLHAHHPRDCLYHLRDWSVPRLRNLLQHHGVTHPIMFWQRHGAVERGRRDVGVCAVMEHKEPGSAKEEPCGRVAFAEYAGYCTLHYKECLVELINQNRLDPVVLLDGSELQAELGRWKIPVPEKQPLESDKLYKERLKQILRERVGLIGGATPGLRPAGPPTPSPSPTSPPAAVAPWYSVLHPGRGGPDDTQLLLLLND
ncbi:uncharacterized protein si:dkey-181m9.8 [Electrophorus electricus]|uniref:RBR-type E3 ubiquitin transferase n=1 Tax=Electrophorus electricus TaxID=8005 RepID=A0A4W4HBB4_ELEEL|nr:uncharacterized protein si:dkey-181m9.8 [Electrophorus electricus]